MAKKVLSIALALMMMLSLSITAFAVDSADIEEVALEAAQAAFTAAGYDESVATAAKISTVVDNGDNTYTVVVKSGLLYSYTCTVTENTGWGSSFSVSNGEVSEEDSIFMIILNQIYEFFSGIFSMFTGFFS